jgi:hypothetical protein
MDTEQLKLVIDALNGVSGDAKQVFMVYFGAMFLKPVLLNVIWVGLLTYGIKKVVGMMKWSEFQGTLIDRVHKELGIEQHPQPEYRRDAEWYDDQSIKAIQDLKNEVKRLKEMRAYKFGKRGKQ